MNANIQRLRAPNARPDTMAILRGAQMTNDALNQLSGSIGQFGLDRRSGQVNEFLAQDAKGLTPEQIRTRTSLIGQGSITKQSQHNSDNLVNQLINENVTNDKQNFLIKKQENLFGQQNKAAKLKFENQKKIADELSVDKEIAAFERAKNVLNAQKENYNHSENLAGIKYDYKIKELNKQAEINSNKPTNPQKLSTFDAKITRGYIPDQVSKHLWLNENGVQMIQDKKTKGWKYKIGTGNTASVDAAFEFMRNQQKLKNQKKPSPKETLNAPTSTVSMDNVPKGMESKPFNTGGTMLDRTTNKLLKALRYPGYN